VDVKKLTYTQMAFFPLIATLLLFCAPLALAQTTITVSSDKTQYVSGDQVAVSGTISEVSASTAVTIEIKKPDGSTWVFDTVSPDSTGSWSISNINLVTSNDPLGVYTIRATYGSLAVQTATFEIIEVVVTVTETTVSTTEDPTSTVFVTSTTTIPETVTSTETSTNTVKTTQTSTSTQTVTGTKTETQTQTTSRTVTGTATVTTTLTEDITSTATATTTKTQTTSSTITTTSTTTVTQLGTIELTTISAVIAILAVLTAVVILRRR